MNAKKKNYRFAMVLKGAKVVGLKLSKKEIKKLPAWKSELSGTAFVTGVCGPNSGGSGLAFHISDDNEPVSKEKLRDFVNMEAGKQMQPLFIVSSPMAGATLEGEPKHEELAATTGTPEEEEIVELLVQRFERLDETQEVMRKSVKDALGVDLPKDKHQIARELAAHMATGEAALSKAEALLKTETSKVIGKQEQIDELLSKADDDLNNSRQALQLAKESKANLLQQLELLDETVQRDGRRMAGTGGEVEQRAEKLARALKLSFESVKRFAHIGGCLGQTRRPRSSCT